MIDKAQHSSGSTVLESIERGDLPGIGMVIIDGSLSAERSRNTPPATRVPTILGT
jgi:enamidase